jgi:heat shock protein HslJ
MKKTINSIINKKIMKTIIYTCYICIFLLSACATSKSQAIIATENSISGINWSLKKMYMTETTLDISNPNAFIKFDALKNSAGGKGGCNSFGSSYTVSKRQISFKNIFSTKMFCEKFQAQEDAFFRQLEKVNRFDVKNGKLLLYMDNALLLEFSK